MADGTVTPAMPPGDAGLDATVRPDADEGLFDVVIPYVDRMLVAVQPPPDAGEQEGGGVYWPPCAPDIYDPIALIGSPAEYDDAGHVIAAPDGSVCATYPWMGRLDWTNCTRGTLDIQNSATVTFPPCTVFYPGPEKATQGAGAGRPISDLCKELWECMVSSGCGADNRGNFCLCGLSFNTDQCNNLDALDPDSGGPCKAQELAAMQLDPHDKVAMAKAGTQYFAISTLPFSTAAALNQLWENGATSVPGTPNCYVDAGAP
jgi:hypothetical protein